MDFDVETDACEPDKREVKVNGITFKVSDNIACLAIILANMEDRLKDINDNVSIITSSLTEPHFKYVED